MGFEKINGLDYEEYKKEVKRRQSMAGKEIGKTNLLKRNKELANKTKEKVYTAIRALKNLKQKVTIMRVVEIAEVSKTTAQKYIKQAKEEGLI
jgi:response regulator of citrate/malate metabolism